MTSDNFLDGIAENPGSDQLRLVFADWLEERGETDRPEAIRLGFELASIGVDDPRRRELLARQQDLVTKHSGEWVGHCGLPLTWDEMMRVFGQSLGETIVWCQGRKVPSLRTPELQPLGDSLRTFSFPRPLVYDLPNKANAVNQVVATRKRLLAHAGNIPREPATELAGGRLVVFHPDASLFDGAAEAESDGFFDESNVPAWDTWVMFAGKEPPEQDSDSYNTHLVAWVPPALVDLVQAGIEVNAEECIKWASDVDTVLTRKLKDMGLA